ncbi:MAG: lysine--tRNA ligase [Deltaproteobacteria bacterium]|nr:lysine--tRNA ligase [Deltaproteobacteria bacterium]MBP7291219.1 lysine--tRNA ligase [Nannocystaceae bacterium]
MDELHHWADVAAARTLQAHPQRDSITVAAGITPSGVVHIGNFREVMTVDLVARALRDRGVKVRFLYSWDDFDVFRKVPADAPAAESLQQQLGRSIADVPDPWGEHDSYASHHIASFEQSLEPLGIRPEFIRQSRAYRAGRYAEGVRAALQHAGTIRGILNAARERNGARSLLPDTWLPLAGFCRACGFDDLDFAWDGEWTVQVHCKHDGCGSDHAVDLRQGGDLKLPWRVDWPMRWGFEQVCFEPGGKDHSSAGGSYDTAKDIVREVYGWVAPQYVGYDFVTLKGAAGKISSSKGGVVTVADCLEVYEPEVLRWMFASYRPNTEFQISFDLDVIKLYEDYDRCVRLAHESDDGSSKDKKRQAARRTLQLASVDHRGVVAGGAVPCLVPFRHLGVVVQIFDGDLDRTLAQLRSVGAVPDDEGAIARARVRAERAWRWVCDYAPEDFRYRIRAAPERATLDAEAQTLLARLVELLRGEPAASLEAALTEQFKRWSGEGIDLKRFYPVVYGLLLAREQGPKLTSLLATMGPARALPLLEPSLGG